MAKAFSEEEKLKIRKDLLECAEELISRQGVQKTTVDEIVEACHIAKGSFYSFYKTKELLFWDVILRWHEELERNMFVAMKGVTEITPENLTQQVMDDSEPIIVKNENKGCLKAILIVIGICAIMPFIFLFSIWSKILFNMF